MKYSFEMRIATSQWKSTDQFNCSWYQK